MKKALLPNYYLRQELDILFQELNLLNKQFRLAIMLEGAGYVMNCSNIQFSKNHGEKRMKLVKNVKIAVKNLSGNITLEI